MTLDPDLVRLKRGTVHEHEAVAHTQWDGAFAFRTFGLTVAIRTTDAAVLAEMEERLPYGWRPLPPGSAVEYLYSVVNDPTTGSRDDQGYSLYRNDFVVAVEVSRAFALGEIERELLYFIAQHGLRRTFIHAGVVGLHGKAILLPARSQAGKTTLVAELVRQGATYYSDDFAVLDRRGRVHPFATPLKIRQLQAPGGEVRQAVESLGGQAGRKPLPVGLIAFTSHKEGVSWRPQRLTPGRAVLELLNHTGVRPGRMQETLQTLEQAVSQAEVLEGPRGDAAETAEALLRRLGTPARQAKQGDSSR